jgi:predicted phosphatase
MHVSTEDGAAAPHMIIINVKADWIMNNISAMIKRQFGPNSIVYIVDRSGHIMEAVQQQAASEQVRKSCVDSEAMATEGQYWCSAGRV